jgi:hypothetical protein
MRLRALLVPCLLVLGCSASGGFVPTSSSGSAAPAGGSVGGVDLEWSRWLTPAEAPASSDYTTDIDTVTDNVTGLTWQRGVSTTNTWDEAKTYCAGLSLGGMTWRLPTAIELLSIVDSSRVHPSINTTAFPSTPPTWFWASTPYAGPLIPAPWDPPDGFVWGVHFNFGYSHALRRRDEDGVITADDPPHGVRCVRGVIGLAATGSAGAPQGRFVVNADAGTVRDATTNLTWQRTPSCPSGDRARNNRGAPPGCVSGRTYSWAEAAAYCQALNLGGFSTGWRLPTKKELETLINFRGVDPSIDETAFPNTPSHSFWTSTPDAGSSNEDNGKRATRAWYVGLVDGYSFSWGMEYAVNVRCVQ